MFSFWRRWMMDEKRMIYVVLVLGFLSIGTDLGANVVRVYKQFVLASLLEIIAVVALAIAHAIINVETGCARVPCQLNVNYWTEIAAIFGSWFTFAAASLCFLVSAVYDLGYFRDTVKPRFFDIGALLSFFCLVFDVVYLFYLIICKHL